jgi:hypothetical protein
MTQPLPQHSSDLLMIERVLYALWAPQDVSPQRPAEMLNDATADRLTINDVHRARCALSRLTTAMTGEESRP